MSIWNNYKGNDIFIEAWNDYCKVDSRYITPYSPSEYVWNFELLNFILATLFLLFLVLLLLSPPPKFILATSIIKSKDSVSH